MRNHTQEPSTPKALGFIQDQAVNHHSPIPQKHQSLFNLVQSIKGNKTVICSALTGKQATSLVTALGKELNSPLLIKFTGMAVAK